MVKAIVGANWGDEGKGKITDLMAEASDIVVRFQGGANAGHTIINDYGRFALHTLPSGVFYAHITNVIGNGVALDMQKITSELRHLAEAGVPTPNLMISDRAQLLLLSGPPKAELPPSTQTNMPKLVSRSATCLILLVYGSM